VRYATTLDVGDRKRSSGINEDSVALSVFEDGHREGFEGQSRPGGEESEPATRSAAVFALADGAGGHDAGDVASYIASTVVTERLAGTAIRAARSDPGAFDLEIATGPEVPSAGDIRAAIEEAVVAAHRAILTEARESGTGAYTTVVAGIAVGGQLHYGWVGDSRAYVCNRDHETIERLTRDHAVVARLQEAGEIDDTEAHVHPRGNEITRALGGSGAEDPGAATVAVETGTVSLFAEDVVVVTSDGLVDAQTDAPDLYDRYVGSGRNEAVAAEVEEAVVTDDDIRDWVLGAETLEAAAQRLVDRANDRGGKDNLSVVLLADGTLPETPAELSPRGIDAPAPVEDRETTLLPEGGQGDEL
jgi:serine/threonine protein phosphatase PrpC